MSSHAPTNPDKKGKGKEESKQEPVRPLYESDRPELIVDHGICTTFSNQGVLPQNVVLESELHTSFAQNISIHTLIGRGANQYVAWLLSKPTVKKIMINLFILFLLNEDREFLYKHLQTLMETGANEVFVEKVNGKPYGKYMSNLCRSDDRRRAPALFVAFFGRRNASPCECCLARMSRNFKNGVPVMVPFFECRSIPGFKKGACANCLYHVEGGSCTFNRDSYIPAVEAAAAPLNYEFEGAPRSELTLGKYTQVDKEFDFDEAREEAIGKVKGFRPRPKKPKPEEKRSWE